MKIPVPHPLLSIFRTVAGFAFLRQERTYWQINRPYSAVYDALQDEGVYRELVKAGLMLGFKESGLKQALTEEAYRVLLQRPLPFISYPYEWSFSQFQAAARTILHVAAFAEENGLSLVDASPFGVQFINGTALWTNPLAFEIAGARGWRGYERFIGTVLAPLALSATLDVRMVNLLQIYPDGVPLEVVSGILPTRTLTHIGLTTHLRVSARATFDPVNIPPLTLIHDLLDIVNNLKTKVTPFPRSTQTTTYDNASAQLRESIVKRWLTTLTPNVVWDVHAGDGSYARLAASGGAQVLALSANPDNAEALYRDVQLNNTVGVLPLWVDFSSPTPGTGWLNRERLSIIGRSNANLILLLDGLPRLALGAKIPLAMIAEWLARLSEWAIVEYIPPTDPMALAVLTAGDALPDDYSEAGLQAALLEYFTVEEATKLPYNGRVMFVIQRKAAE
ncbi:MAG: hypothetical protein ACOYL5_10910 [Phototrophicaceae bacterium]